MFLKTRKPNNYSRQQYEGIKLIVYGGVQCSTNEIHSNRYLDGLITLDYH